MKKNKIAQQIAQTNKVLLDIGVTSGKQQMIDCLTLALHDPEVMGKDTFGRTRIERVINGMLKYDEMFSEAYQTGKEARECRERLDDELKKVWDKDFVPFNVRQPYIDGRN